MGKVTAARSLAVTRAAGKIGATLRLKPPRMIVIEVGTRRTRREGAARAVEVAAVLLGERRREETNSARRREETGTSRRAQRSTRVTNTGGAPRRSGETRKIERGTGATRTRVPTRAQRTQEPSLSIEQPRIVI